MYKTGFKKISTLVLCALALSACNRGGQGQNDPKNRLKDYISKSFSITSTQDRTSLTEYMSGEAKRRLVAWSDEQFREAFIDSKRQFIKLVFSELKTVSPKEVNITYELTYMDQGKGHDAKVTNKKMAAMTEDQGKWYIAEVKTIKELIEYRNEMSLP